MVLSVGWLHSRDASAQSLHVGVELNTYEPGPIDGVYGGVKFPVTGRLGASLEGFGRISTQLVSEAQVRTWRESLINSDFDEVAYLPVGADVWSVRGLLGYRLIDQDFSLEAHAGWALRRQANAQFAVMDHSTTEYYLVEESLGAPLEWRTVNPLIGLAFVIPVFDRISLRVDATQGFWVNDPFVSTTTLCRASLVVDAFGRELGGSRSSESDSESLEIEETGIAAVDDVFAEVQAIKDELSELQEQFDAAEKALEEISDEWKEKSLMELLERARSEVSLNFEIRMEGDTPRVRPTAHAEGQTKKLVDALDQLAVAASATVAAGPKILSRSRAVAEKAQGLAEQAPQLAKDSGLSPLEIPSALRALKGNLSITVRLPGDVETTVQKAADTLSVLKNFKRGG